MADQRSLDLDASMRDFQSKLRECTMQAACGRPYVLVAKLTEWLRPIVSGSGSDTTRASRLLVAAYRNRHQPGLPISVEQFSGDDCCLLVFCILLTLDWGELVDIFQRCDVVDRLLPIPLRELRAKLETAGLPDAEKLATRFDEMQWRFCPARFDLHMGRDHVKNRIIPICRKEEINSKGGTAQLWQIDVQEEFVGCKLKKVVSSSRFNANNPNKEPDYRYQFALKTFQDGNRSLYTNEKEAFHALRDHKGMVQYLADYGHKETRLPPNASGTSTTEGEHEITKTTYNILLEFGDMDLDEFFAERLPPVLQTEVEAFWKALFEVADAVESIHNLITCTGGVVQEYHGWHADIKPDNILSVQGKFKLADPGFAKFVKKTDKIPEEFVLGGTETYGAPERHPGRRGTLIAVPQTIDTWSLGCVFSIAATWMVLGYQGIRQFGKMREKAIQKIIQEQHTQHPPWTPTSGLSAGDYFHDGRQVLDDVISWHRVLRNVLRRTDTMTSRVLDLVDQKMLLGVAKERITAKDLCTELRRIAEHNQAEPRDAIPESIMAALLEVDEEAPSKPVESISIEATPDIGQSGIVSQDRKARKSKLSGLPLMKTTHRSEYLKSALAAHHVERETPVVPFHNRSEDPIPTGVQGSLDSVVRSSPPRQISTPTRSENAGVSHRNGFHQIPSDTSIPRVPIRQKISRGHAPQNVFQARQEIERRQEIDRRGKFITLSRQPKKDQLLTRFFGNRDISKKFLVDNAESMRQHWYEATYLLDTLVMKAAGQDDDGMDLTFTTGPEKLERKKSTSEFTKIMKKAEPMDGVHTDMRRPLGDIFSNYIEETQKRKKYLYQKDVKNLTLIILTDGIWAGMGSNKDAVNQKIVSFIKNLEETIGKLKDRPVSIEFIQFGNDEDATYRLERLDKDLKCEGIPDIIDTEPSSGDVNKMLLGSFVEEYDEEGEDATVDPGYLMQRTESPEEIRELSSLTRNSTFQPFSPMDRNLDSSPPNGNLYSSSPWDPTRQNTSPNVRPPDQRRSATTTYTNPRYYSNDHSLKPHGHR
ncbi:MAG: hypothetical protein M1816_005081 [Peltula sp. TS41687]|nr:MAG: hypothetical protein M1816_005081 [Peltula sp. TS41687]